MRTRIKTPKVSRWNEIGEEVPSLQLTMGHVLQHELTLLVMGQKMVLVYFQLKRNTPDGNSFGFLKFL